MSENYSKKVIDVGAGDAKFAYSIARSHADWLVYAADASTNMFDEVEEKVRRKPAKGGLRNLILLQLAAENIPTENLELFNQFDQVYVNFPWGSLLRGVIHSEPEVLGNVAKLLKPGGKLQILLTYDPSYEQQTMSDLDLKPLDDSTLRQIASSWIKFNLQIEEIANLNQLDLNALADGVFQTTWWKKIRQRERVVWKIQATKTDLS